MTRHQKLHSRLTILATAAILLGALACEEQNTNSRKGRSNPSDGNEEIPGYLSEHEFEPNVGGVVEVQGSKVTVDPETSDVRLRIKIRRYDVIDETGHGVTLNGAIDGAVAVEVFNVDTNQIASVGDLKKSLRIEHGIQTDLENSELAAGVVSSPNSDDPGYSKIANSDLAIEEATTLSLQKRNLLVSAKVQLPDFIYFVAPDAQMTEGFSESSWGSSTTGSTGGEGATSGSSGSGTTGSGSGVAISKTDTLHLILGVNYYSKVGAENWSTATQLFPANGANQTTMLIDSEGNPHVLNDSGSGYGNQSTPGNRDHSYFVDGIWETENLVAPGTSVPDRSRTRLIGFDANQRPIYVTREWSASETYSSVLQEYRYGTSYSPVESILGWSDNGTAVGDPGFPLMIATGGGQTYFLLNHYIYSKSTGANWPVSAPAVTSFYISTCEPPSGGTAFVADLAVDSGGKAHLLYFCYTTTDQLRLYYFTNQTGSYSTKTAALWPYATSSATNALNAATNLGYASKVLTADGNVYVVYPWSDSAANAIHTPKIRISKMPIGGSTFTHSDIDLPSEFAVVRTQITKLAVERGSDGTFHFVVGSWTEASQPTYSVRYVHTSETEVLSSTLLVNGTISNYPILRLHSK